MRCVVRAFRAFFVILSVLTCRSLRFYCLFIVNLLTMMALLLRQITMQNTLERFSYLLPVLTSRSLHFYCLFIVNLLMMMVLLLRLVTMRNALTYGTR
ncbi:hypothetical protein KS4_31060 [Poriferisphaera corsica]|uniref:Uncharacterized protein n=1 Tax=Poriferisphaera corsica TaxID=2528020 RepID=A0A517YXV0_9BACT|nr:hypothetical protein KS4_31060 [Poriferisphaera corsica]